MAFAEYTWILEGMLDPAEFGEDIEAYLRYFQALGEGDESKLVDQLARSGWGRHPVPTTWLSVMRSMGATPRLIEALVDRMLEGTKGRDCDGVRAVVVEVASVVLRESTDDRLGTRFLDWLVGRAADGPGEASIVADVAHRLTLDVGHAWPPHLKKYVRPVTEWLLRHGAAELRAARRAPLLVQLAAALEADSSAIDLRVDLLRYLAVNDRSWECWQVFPTANFIWPAIEAGLVKGALNWQLVGTLMRVLDHLPSRSIDLIFAPFDPENKLPRSREALFSCLQRGLIARSIVRDAWRQALLFAPPAELSIDDAATISVAVEIVQETGIKLEASEKAKRSRYNLHIAEWGRLIFASWIRVYGLVRASFSSGPLSPLASAACRPALTDAVAAALEDALRTAPEQELELARRVAADVRGRPLAAAAIASVLPLTRRPGRDASVDWSALQREIEKVVNHAWIEPIGDMNPRDVLGAGRGVAFEDLEDDDQIQIRGEIVGVSRPAIERVWKAARDPETAVAYCLLFFAHELVHVWQGVGSKNVITHIRAIGSEPTIVHLDLAADHAGARIIAKAIPRWSLAGLKDLQGRSLVAFHADSDHTTAARARKAARLVGLRVDVLARELFKCTESEYVFADYGLAGGWFLAFASGPPMRVVRCCSTLTSAEARTLEQAADEGQSLQHVDELLSRLVLDEAHEGGPRA